MTRRWINVLTATFFVLALAGPLAAQQGERLLRETDENNSRVATRGANFLEIGVGARAMGMAGAFGALSTGSSSLYWNPAGIAVDPAFTAMISYNDMYGDFGIDHFYGGVTLPMGVASFGLHIISLSSGDMLRTTENFPEGGDPQFGETFSWTSFAIGGSYARQITDRLMVGATVKYAQTGIDDAKANFIGGDAGVQFRTGLLGTTIAASLLNIGSEGEFSGTLLNDQFTAASEAFDTDKTIGTEFDVEGWDMPTVFTFSVMWDVVGSPEALLAPNPLHNLVVVTDAVDAIDTDIQARIGLEYAYRDLFFVRGGKQWFNENRADFRDFADGLSGGFGVAVPLGDNRLHLDYAYTDRGLLDGIQVFSVEFRAR